MKRMSGTEPSGTEGYAGEAEALFRQYESICFADVHRHIMAEDIGIPFHPGAAKFYKEAGLTVKAH